MSGFVRRLAIVYAVLLMPAWLAQGLFSEPRIPLLLGLAVVGVALLGASGLEIERSSNPSVRVPWRARLRLRRAPRARDAKRFDRD